MNHAAIYTEATGQSKDRPVKEQTEQDVARAQLKISWLQSTITKETHKVLTSRVDELLKSAMQLAICHLYTTEDDNKARLLIAQQLVQARTIQQIIEEYYAQQ